MKDAHDARKFFKKMFAAQGWVPELFYEHERSMQGGSTDVVDVEQGPDCR